MAKNATESRKASFEVNTIGTYLGPVHQELVSVLNDYHEAVETSDRETMCELEKLVPSLLDEFARIEVSKSPNPPWLLSKMHAGWHLAKGDYEEALAYELKGWKFAEYESDRPESREETARRKSVSASNIADELRRLGRSDEALKWARVSIELWPSNTINHLVLAMAVYRAGHPQEAGRIIEELLRVADFQSGRDVLANCMAYERELHEMNDLAVVQTLLENLGTHRISKP